MKKDNKTSECTHCICNLNNIEACLNQHLCCLCYVETIFCDFIAYCNDIDIEYKKLAELHAQYKQVTKKG